MDHKTLLRVIVRADILIVIVFEDEGSHCAKGPLKFDGERYSVESLSFEAKHVEEIMFTEEDHSEAEIYITC